jgi:TonB family protein
LGAVAQDPTPAAPTIQAAQGTPIDPKALMLQAAKLNGLTGDDVKPWHLKVTYQLLGDDGKPTDQGTYEEFWVSPTKYKRTYTGNNMELTDYGTEKGVLRSGRQQGPPLLVSEVHRKIVGPMQDPKVIGIENYAQQQKEVGGKKFNCLNMKDLAGGTFGPTWCLDDERPILRFSGTPQGGQLVRTALVEFGGHFVAKDLAFYQSGKQNCSAHIETIESIQSIDDAMFLPPADALPAKPESFANGLTEGFVIRRVTPDYPAAAKNSGVKGTVVIKGEIGKDGHVLGLIVESGPLMLQQAALDAAKQWQYRPFLLNNEPVEVMTTINMRF